MQLQTKVDQLKVRIREALSGGSLEQHVGPIFRPNLVALGATDWGTADVKAPYTDEQYHQAYMNAEVIASAMKYAHDHGYNRIELPSGHFPVVASRGKMLGRHTEITTNQNQFCIAPRGLMKGLEITMYGTEIFEIFDSDKRSPFDLFDGFGDPTKYNTYEYGAHILSFPDSRNMIVYGGKLIGSQDKRSFLQKGELSIENGYGYFQPPNSRNTRFIGTEFVGFRGDGISGAPRGYPLFYTGATGTMVWHKGGLDKDGQDAKKVGVYTTNWLDLSKCNIIDNAVQLCSTGSTRYILFKNLHFHVYVYDKDKKLIWTRKFGQSEWIQLPTNYHYIRLSTDNERKDVEKMDYGAMELVTGSSDRFSAEYCVFRNCHRGCISNIGFTFNIKGALAIDVGAETVEKYGYGDAPDPTNYFVNVEDNYSLHGVVEDCITNHCATAFLMLIRDVVIRDNYFANMTGGGGILATQSFKITGNTTTGAGIAVIWPANDKRPPFPRYGIIKDNFTNAMGNNSTYQLESHTPDCVIHKDNIVEGCRVYLKGSGLHSTGNKYTQSRAVFGDALEVVDVREFKDAMLEEKDDVTNLSKGWRNLFHVGKTRDYSDNMLRWYPSTEQNNSFTLNNTAHHTTLGVIHLQPIWFKSKVLKDLDFTCRPRQPGQIDQFDMYGSSYEQARFRITNGGVAREYNDFKLTVEKTKLINSLYYLNRHDNTAGSTVEITFKDVEIVCDLLECLVDLPRSNSIKKLILNFKRCDFVASKKKNLRLVRLLGKGDLEINGLESCDFTNVNATFV